MTTGKIQKFTRGLGRGLELVLDAVLIADGVVLVEVEPVLDLGVGFTTFSRPDVMFWYIWKTGVLSC
jgi:hypothetical protein